MQRASYVLSVLGILLIIAGAVLIIIGVNMNNNFYAQVEYYYAHGQTDSSGSNLITGGIITAGVGAVMIVTSILLMHKVKKSFSGKVHDQDYDQVDDMIAQMAGNRTIFDIFHSEDKTRIFSFYRNKTCILKDGDNVYRGKMEPLTWEAGHPTLWRITLDINGKMQAFEVSKVEGNILVKNNISKEIFYRN